jgi:arabinan endo-1,5-alpha-L-arabinosidase
MPLSALLAGLTLVVVALSGCTPREAPGLPPNAPGSPPAAPGLPLTGDISPVHDPTLVMEGGSAHLFSTSQVGQAPGLIHWRTSTDLLNWTRNGAVFTEMPAWASEEVPGTRGIWAPDISYVNGEFRLYYSVSRFGQNDSAIGLAVTKTLVRSDPRFGWVDRGLVFRSEPRDDFNAIDPDLLVDGTGRHWLSFGSFWTGIKLIELDPMTGKPAGDDPRMYDLARRSSPGAIEAPTMIERNGWFYLFASFEFCCRGVDSTYYTVVGRAESPTGPFRDAEGRSMNEGGGRIFLHGDLDPTRRWIGPGHPAILSMGGADFVAYHAYDRNAAGRPTLRIQRVAWSEDGWPVAQ